MFDPFELFPFFSSNQVLLGNSSFIPFSTCYSIQYTLIQHATFTHTKTFRKYASYPCWTFLNWILCTFRNSSFTLWSARSTAGPHLSKSNGESVYVMSIIMIIHMKLIIIKSKSTKNFDKFSFLLIDLLV